MIYVVLGMHKSGTTLVSQILHESGINMGECFDADVSYDKGNKYERETVLGLNMFILGARTYRVLDVGADRARDLSPEQRELMRTIIRDCDARHDVWGFKDPRTALTYPLWEQELPPHRIIAIVRDPAEVWPRFRYGGRRRYLGNFNYAWNYVNRWYESNLTILETLQKSANDAILLQYGDLMTDDAEFRRLQDFVGRPLTDRRRPDLYRSRGGMDLFLRLADSRLKRKTGATMLDFLERMRTFTR